VRAAPLFNDPFHETLAILKVVDAFSVVTPSQLFVQQLHLGGSNGFLASNLLARLQLPHRNDAVQEEPDSQQR
jgi:hypothetical protein